MTDAPTVLDAFMERARARLNPLPPDVTLPARHGDHAFEPSLREIVAQQAPRAAAVLIPVVDRSEPTVLLTQRTEHLPSHAGQIAFPGGKIDETDASPLDAALREAEEEIGLAPDHVRLLGYLDVYETTSGFAIVPVIGLVTPPFALAPNPEEVADVFEVPLAFLMDARNHEQHVREWQGRQRRYYAMPWRDRYIWGVTAGILHNLHARLYGP